MPYRLTLSPMDARSDPRNSLPYWSVASLGSGAVMIQIRTPVGSRLCRGSPVTRAQTTQSVEPTHHHTAAGLLTTHGADEAKATANSSAPHSADLPITSPGTDPMDDTPSTLPTAPPPPRASPTPGIILVLSYTSTSTSTPPHHHHPVPIPTTPQTPEHPAPAPTRIPPPAPLIYTPIPFSVRPPPVYLLPIYHGGASDTAVLEGVAAAEARWKVWAAREGGYGSAPVPVSVPASIPASAHVVGTVRKSKSLRSAPVKRKREEDGEGEGEGEGEGDEGYAGVFKLLHSYMYICGMGGRRVKRARRS